MSSERPSLWAKLTVITGFLSACVAVAGLFSQCSEDSKPATSYPQQQSVVMSSQNSVPMSPPPLPALAQPVQNLSTGSSHATVCVTPEWTCHLQEQLPPGVACYCSILGVPFTLGITR